MAGSVSYDICIFCDGEGTESYGWECGVCRGSGMADERLMQMEWACAGSSLARCDCCDKPVYKCERREWEEE